MEAAYTPWMTIVGGLLIGLASAALLSFNGRIAGISGIFDGALFRHSSDSAWRLVFLLGLVAGAGVWFAITGVDTASMQPDRSTALIVVAGLLVGFGTKMSNGCTSGHGVCGNARLSSRSMVATAVFIAVGGMVVGALGGAA